MNCKNCGAPLPVGRNCEYCGTKAQPETVSRIIVTATGITAECRQIGLMNPEMLEKGRLTWVIV